LIITFTYDVQFVVDTVLVRLLEGVEWGVVVDRRFEGRMVIIRQQVHPVQVSEGDRENVLIFTSLIEGAVSKLNTLNFIWI
jgi:hypothetical protein